MAKQVLTGTDFRGMNIFRKGKVRDVYDLGDKLLIVSTDRISCFDVILPCGIPYKGEVLTAISKFWFDFTKDLIPNHFISSQLEEYPRELKIYDED
ncbi:MAG: phosphoribosylaminoimidazolesuccinocarboxamide synthase, partial [Candidatus Omnitrophica bacterium]|nr:phosphoribosylaminoimidazolesuccinocarboxamide synthase [Candidatus Omnitrophota bacterium]